MDSTPLYQMYVCVLIPRLYLLTPNKYVVQKGFQCSKAGHIHYSKFFKLIRNYMIF